MLKDVGVYDEACQRSEDVDICARIARSNWLIFLCGNMVLEHRSRISTKDLLAQWWGYGKYIPYVFQKYNAGQWEVFLCRTATEEDGRSPAGQYTNLLYMEGMAATVCVFISPFLIFHAFLLADVLCLLLGGHMLVHFLLAGATFVSFIWYLQPDFAEGVMNGKAFPLAIVRYFVNVAFVVSHLVNGLRHRTLYLAQVIGQRGSRIDAPR